MPTKLCDLKQQNVRLGVGKAFLKYLKVHPNCRGGGTNAKGIDPKKLRFDVGVDFAKTLDVFKHTPRSVASKRVRACLAQYQKYGYRYAGAAGVAVSKKQPHSRAICNA